MPAVDPTTDPDFMAAAPHEQMAYLSHIDPEFAKANPQDQLGYLMHIRGLSPNISGAAKPSSQMETNPLGALAPRPITSSGQLPDKGDIAVPSKPSGQIPGSFEGSYSSGDTEYGKAMTGAGLTAAAGLGAAAIAPAASAGYQAALKAHPIITQLATMAGIANARKIPYVGQYIPPMAEFIGLMAKTPEAAESAKIPPVSYSGTRVAEPVPQTAPPPVKYSTQMSQPQVRTAPPPPLKWSVSAPTTPEAIAADRYQVVNMSAPAENVPLPNIAPTKAATVDPYRQQMLPPMTKGVSGNIEAHAYDPASQEMITHFKSGDIYKYEGVPPKVYDQFVNAESQGSFHFNNIRGRYATEKIGKVAPTRTRGQQVSTALSGQ